MEFRTIMDYPQANFSMSHSDNFLLLGSCFAENIGSMMIDNKFHCELNPYGILYNPFSISRALREIISGKQYTEKDLFFYRECYHSYMHHGSFSAFTQDKCLTRVNEHLKRAHELCSTSMNYLIITFGTSWVYTLKETNEVVSNCHKLPAANFIRRLLTVDEIVADYTSLISKLLESRPSLKIVFTVSPIRHIKDGLHANQISKSTLLLAIDMLQKVFPNIVFYFPAYEILMDELRDYRFYADDMIHPSDMAIRYIWNTFAAFYFSKEATKIMQEYGDIHKALSHKPFRRDSEEYKRFLGQIVLKIKRLKEKYPYLDVEKEIELCHIQLNQ